MTTATTILQQLGGRRFQVMTGSYNFVSNGNSLTMKLRRNAAKATHLRITLTSMDDYTMEFISCRGASIKTKAEFEGVYCDQLQSFFTETTGLYTSL